MCDDKDENENEGDSEGEHVIDMVNRDFCSIKNASRVYIDCCENDDDTDNGESKCNDEKDRKNRNGNYDDKNDDSDGNYDASDDHHSRNKDLDSYFNDEKISHLSSEVIDNSYQIPLLPNRSFNIKNNSSGDQVRTVTIIV